MKDFNQRDQIQLSTQMLGLLGSACHTSYFVGPEKNFVLPTQIKRALQRLVPLCHRLFKDQELARNLLDNLVVMIRTVWQHGQVYRKFNQTLGWNKIFGILMATDLVC